jgi:ferredoxin
MKVTIDTDKCISAGQCVLVAPDVFDQRDEDGLVILLNASPSLNQAVDVKQAATLPRWPSQSKTDPCSNEWWFADGSAIDAYRSSAFGAR